MARPLRRDWFAWFTTLPSSATLVVCLFLPQFRDCNGHEKSAFDTNTAGLMIGIALLGILPLLWRWRPKNMGPYEELAGFISFMLTLAFIPVFPLAGLFAKWHTGACLTWAAAWIELVGMVSWTSAATTRREIRRATAARGDDPALPLDPLG